MRRNERNSGQNHHRVDGMNLRAFMALVHGRRSVRAYRPDPVPREVVLEMLEAGRWAPSAVNLQPWQFVVVTDRETIRALGRIARFLFVRWRHVGEAPVVVALVGNPAMDRWYKVDCALAGENILLAAQAAGLGACWVGGFSEPKARRILGIPDHLEVIGLITLGYPDEKPAPTPRLELEQLVHYDRFDPARAPSAVTRATRSGVYSLRKRIRKLFRGIIRK